MGLEYTHVPNTPLAPRPALEVHQQLLLDTSSLISVDEKDEALLESRINNEFLEPDELGTLAHVFRSTVSADDFTDTITVTTTTSFLEDNEIDEIISIVQDELDVVVESYEIEGVMRREASVIDRI